MAEIETLDVRHAHMMLKKAIREKERRALREEWLAQVPFMAIKMLKFTDFETYAGQRTGSNIDRRPAEEILKEAEEARRITIGEGLSGLPQETD